MRGVRLAAFALVGVLVCLVISRVLSVEPAPSGDDSADNQPGTPPPTVPAPPPLPGSQVVPPPKKSPAPVRVAKTQPKLPPTRAAAIQVMPQDAKAVIWSGEIESIAAVDAAPAPEVTETAAVDEPRGPVIVVPHERPKEGNRGIRWLKAVGRVLGIGGKPSPEDEAFRVN